MPLGIRWCGQRTLRWRIQSSIPERFLREAPSPELYRRHSFKYTNRPSTAGLAPFLETLNVTLNVIAA
ncbi:hypothetical protein H0H92_004636 [Tricholoma furcatifolium]|nr:hypothetical protein H0H92_004636 [Tricholoma furcatifolium]